MATAVARATRTSGANRRGGRSALLSADDGPWSLLIADSIALHKAQYSPAQGTETVRSATSLALVLSPRLDLRPAIPQIRKWRGRRSPNQTSLRRTNETQLTVTGRFLAQVRSSVRKPCGFL